MDELKKFERLSDPEKIKIMKFYELFSSGSLEAQLDTEVESIPSKPVGKQKTLDGWLLKSKGISGLNSNLDIKNSGKKNADTEKVKSTHLSENEKNLKDAVKCTDLKISESRNEKTSHDNSIRTPDNISEVVGTNSEDEPPPVENDKTKCVAEKNYPRIVKFSSSESRTENHRFGKKNPFVLIEKLDSILNPKLFTNSSETCSTGSYKILHLNDKSRQRVTVPKLSTESNETPIQASSNEDDVDALEISSLDGGSSCNEKNREAYFKLKKLCSDQELDLDDIFQAQEFKEMIEKYKFLPGAIVFIGSHKCFDTGKVMPTVNFHKSKNNLLQALSALKTRNSLGFQTLE